MISKFVLTKREVFRKHAVLIFLLLALLAGVNLFVSCSSKKAVKTTATSSTADVHTTITTSTTPKVTTTPKLQQASFALLLTPPQTYTEYTLPLYLISSDILHLEWTISGVGEHIRMSISTPDGQYFGVKTKGGFVALTPDKTCDQLYRTGSIILKLSDQKWVNGYYVFHPYICNADPTVTVKLMYWIEQ